MFLECAEFSFFGVYIPIEMTVSAFFVAAYLLGNRFVPQLLQQCRRTASRGIRRS